MLYLINSLIASSVSTLISTVLGLLAGYGFLRFKFSGRDSFLLSFILMRCIPGIALSLLLLVLYFSSGLIDILLGLVIVYSALNTPFVAWMMKGFFDEVPREIDEAAQVDGCSSFGAFLRVILPISKSGIVANASLAFLLSWVGYPIAFVITSSTRSRTIPPGIFTFMVEFHMDWGGLSATSTIVLIPAIIIMMLTQRYIIRGLTFGAVKG